MRLMSAVPPGSVAWLLLHELRLRFRGNPRSRLNAPLLGGISGLLHVLGVGTAFGVSHMPAQSGTAVMIALTTLMCSTFLFMLSTTLVSATQALYERGDMDLLMSSPVSRRAILWVRATAMAVGLVAGSGFLMWPVANGFILFGYFGAAAAYVWLPALALLATGLGIALTLALFRLIGPRRTRLTAQIIGAATGLSFALVFQGPNLFSPEQKQALFQHMIASAGSVNGLLWLPAQAALGETGPLLGLVAAGFGTFALVVWALATRFTGAAGSVVATATGRPGRDRPGRDRAVRNRVWRGRGSPVAILRAKELRLLARDPWLLTQMSQQIVSILPLGFVLFRHDMGFGSLAWLAVVAGTGVISGGTVWLVAVGEEVPDLLASAPLKPRTILWAKLQAAYLPVLAMMLPLAIFAGAGPGGAWLGVTMAVCSVGAGLSVGMLNLQYAPPARRADFRLRHKGRLILGAGEMLVAMGWVGAAALMLGHSIWAIAVFLLLLAPVPGGLLKFSRANRLTGTASAHRSFG